VAVVTGAGKRLGRQIALAFAGAGYDVVVNYLSSRSSAEGTADEIRNLGVESIAVQADIGKPHEVDRMFTRILREFGHLDVLVNSASVYYPSRLISTKAAVWQRTLDTNLSGPFYCSRAAAPILKRRKGSCIINIASLGGIQPWKEHLAYSVSKAGLIMLTKCLAKELAPHVRVNAIAPGTISMPGEENKNVQHLSASKILLQRYGNPRDITDLVLYLATQAQYVTGQIISVDGGRSI
jgi:pteridine reductase